MKQPAELARRLKALRNARGLKQIEVAVEVGISRSLLAEIETGKDPGFSTFCKLAEFYGVTLDYLWRGEATTGTANPNERPDEVSLLKFWRTLSDEEKQLLLSLLIRDRAPHAA